MQLPSLLQEKPLSSFTYLHPLSPDGWRRSTPNWKDLRRSEHSILRFQNDQRYLNFPNRILGEEGHGHLCHQGKSRSGSPYLTSNLVHTAVFGSHCGHTWEPRWFTAWRGNWHLRMARANTDCHATVALRSLVFSTEL